MTTRLLLLCTVILESACAHLEPPKPGASFAERNEAWERLRPESVERFEELHGGLVVERWAGSLILHGGTQVRSPVDLLPLVRGDSLTARLARRFQERTEPWKYWGPVIGVSLVSGATALLVPAFSYAFGGKVTGFEPFVGLALLGFGTLAFIIVSLTVGDTEPLRLAAFRAYRTDLHAFLFPEETTPP